MSLEDKVAQMIQAEIQAVTPEDIRKFHLGSVLNGGGSWPNKDPKASLSEWLKLADDLYLASIDKSYGGEGIPLLWGTDAVHGHNNVYRATLFPHNIGLGAMRDPALMKKIGMATALQVKATGIDWLFAPTVAVVRNDRWGRTYEGYSEDPQIVREYAGQMILGIQGEGRNFLGQDHLLATAKHFIGDGGTRDGVDQGDNTDSESELLRLHGAGYESAIQANIQSVMASFNSWNGQKVHGHDYLLKNILRDHYGFTGFVVGDWNGHGQVQGCTNKSCAQAINAGVDMIMVPYDWKEFYYNTIKQVKEGTIPMARINEAVTRILTAKYRAGLFNAKKPSERVHAGNRELINGDKVKELAREAVRKSLVLLKNNNNTLPIKGNAKVLITGAGANDIGLQSGGWTSSWQGGTGVNDQFPEATSLYAGLKLALESMGGAIELSQDGSYNQKPDVIVVAIGEKPYAEGVGDVPHLSFSRHYPESLALLKKVKAIGVPVVTIFLSGRAMWVNPELNLSDAFVAAWLPGTEGQGVADVLIGNQNKSARFEFTGKLSYSWPAHSMQTNVNRHDQNELPLFAYDYGLNYQSNVNLTNTLSEEDHLTAPSEVFVFQTQLIDRWEVSSNPSTTREIVDYRLQGDALKIESSTQSQISFRAKQEIPIDQKQFLKVSIKASDQELSLGLNCPSGVCQKNVSLKDILVPGEWNEFVINLNCFDLNSPIQNFQLSLPSSTVVVHQLSLLKEGQLEEVSCQ